MSQSVDAFVSGSQDRLLEELKTFLRIPSISTLPEHKGDVERAAAFVADALRSAKLENIEVIPTANHPLVYADWLHAPGKPTVLLYGHYDVQPPDPLELWERRPSSRRFATAISTREALPTTKGNSTCISRPSRLCMLLTANCPSM